MIFGSMASGRNSYLSDFDIAIYSDPVFVLIELGKLISKLEILTKQKVDLVELNGLFETNNLLAYEIVSNNYLLFCDDEKLFVDFKSNTFIRYFDQSYLRNQLRKNLLNRINTDTFGKRIDA